MGLTAASDREKLDALIRHGVCLKFYRLHDDPTVTEFVEELEFAAVVHNDSHVLRYISPDRRNNAHSFRPKRHELARF